MNRCLGYGIGAGEERIIYNIRSYLRILYIILFVMKFSKRHQSFPLKKGLSKTHQSSLTLKGGSTSHLGLLPSGEKRKPPYSVLKPLRYKVGGPSEVYASSGAAAFCAGMNPPC